MKNTTISKTRSTVPHALRQWYFGLLALFALTSVTTVTAQTGTVQIGSGTANNSYYLPARAYYGYSYAQQIVTASEYAASGGVAGPITKIRFYLSNASTPLANWNNWTVYMGHTSKTSFASNTDWEPLANLTQVFTGTVTQVSNSWMEITFATPFNYNGTSNLVVAVDENAPSYSDVEVYWGSYTGAANTGIYFYDDDAVDNPNPASPPAALGRTSVLARIQFVGTLASCLAPTGLTAIGNSTTTGTASWAASASAPANGYQYYYSSTNTAPTASTTPSGTVGAGVTTASLTGLTSNTTYYVWVRSACDATTNSSWTAAASFTTPCDPVNVPYAQNFESVTPPALPECTVVVNAGTGNNWKTIASPGAYGFTSKVLNYSWNGTNAANSWFFTRGINLTAGTSYRIAYKYGNNSVSTYTEKMKVAYGTANNVAAMTTTLANHTAINGASAVSTYVDFTPSTTGVYYFGFNAYSIANQDQLYLDDISVTESPSCLTPTALVAGTSTETSVSLSWTASGSTPTSGYQYYYSVTNTAPTASTTASGSVGAGVVNATIGSLTPGTKYFVWVRSNCGAGSFSEWMGPIALTTLCDSPDILSTTPGSICGEGSAQLQATTSSGTLKWYAAATGGTALGTGTTFNTPVIEATTTYYVEAVNASTSNVGATYTGTNNNGTSTGAHGIRITTTQSNTVINTVDIPFTGTGTFTIALRDANSTVITSVTTASVTGNGTTPVTVPLNLTVANPGTYQLVVTAVTGNIGALGYSTGTYPYTTPDGSFSVIGGYWWGNGTDNMYLYNLNVTGGCASARQAVVATVTTAPAVTASVTDATLCAGESTTLSATSANANYTYVWMPGNLSGASQTVSPSGTTIYTVTATDTATNCVVTEQVTVLVNVLPTALVLAESTSICEGSAAVPLAVQGGVTANTIFTQNFNAGAGNWTTDNNSTGGTVANAAWTLRPDGYTIPGYSVTHSNDNSQFYLTNSDAQGSGSTTATILQSPSFNTVGYTSAAINFFHFFYEPSTGSSTGKVEASANGGDWVTIQTYNTTTGNYAAFASATVTLPAAFLNQPDVRIRFKFNGAWRYFWAIDNVSVSGQQSANYTWAPAAGLYTDAAATVAYTGQAAATVYARPTATTTYTVTATNPAGCTVTDQIAVNFTSTPGPTGNATQTLCAGATVADLAATGTNIQWYSSATGGNAIAATTALANGTTYYASQTANGCESASRLAVQVQFTQIAAPTVEDDVQVFCNNATIADLVATGSNIKWYTTPTGGNALTAETALPQGASIYYASQTIDGCEGASRTAVATLVNIHEAPMADATQIFCATSVVTVGDLQAYGSGITWYADATGGTPLSEDTVIANGTTYYASQTVEGCESMQRVAVTAQFTVTGAPTANAVQSFCINSGATVEDLIADGSNIQWYAAAEGGDALAETDMLTDGTTYYASQTIDGCEGAQRVAVTVQLDVTAAPQAQAQQTFCTAGTVAELMASGNGIQWYADATGDTMLSGDTALTDGTVYYASQNVGGCESQERTAVTVTITTASAPQGDAQQVITEAAAGTATLEDITIAGDNIVWYASEEDALAGANALSGNMLITDGATYYAVNMAGNCASEPFAVTVEVVLGTDKFDVSKFTYYPNPVQDVLHISYSSDITSVAVYNMLGQQVLSQQVNAAEGTVDMRSLTEGTYVVNVTAGNVTKTVKVVKKS